MSKPCGTSENDNDLVTSAIYIIYIYMCVCVILFEIFEDDIV